MGLGTGATTDANAVERMLEEQFGMTWQTTAQYQRATKEPRISYGTMGTTATDKKDGRVFPSQGEKWPRR